MESNLKNFQKMEESTSTMLAKRVRDEEEGVSATENKEKRFRLQAKSVLLTYPQCPLEKDEVLDFLLSKGASICIVAREDHHETDGVHLHAYVEFEQKLSTRDCRFFDFKGYHANIGQDKSFGKKSAKSSKIDIIKYVTKDGDYVEFGIVAAEFLKAKKEHRAVIAKELKDHQITLREAVDRDPKLLFCLSTIQKNLAIYDNLKANEKAELDFPRKCYWIYGKPRIGKSYAIRKKFAPVYNKSMDQWWDGYDRHETVLLDDMDKQILTYELKIWADNYIFRAQVKGGSLWPTYKYFFVTSNFFIKELFSIEKVRDAIQARFTEICADEYIGEDGFFDLDAALEANK